MQYFATHYWQTGDENVTSLALQQAYHRRRRMPVLLACVEKNIQKENLLSVRLSDWFYEKGLTLCSRKGEKGVENIAADLERIIKEQAYNEQETLQHQFAGILCVGQHFLLFQRGRQRISLLNTRNHRPHCHDLVVTQEENSTLYLQTGTIQRGVGMLLATDGFHASISNSMVEECLNIREIHSQNQLNRRMRELGGFAEQNGGRDIGAILIVSH